MQLKIFSVVIPVYNEQETIEYSHNRLVASLQGGDLAEFKIIELIYVNDGSRDQSAAMLSEIKRRTTNPGIKVVLIHFSRNFGHSAAVMAGLEQARGDYTLIIDADLQDPPEIVSAMYRKLLEGYEVVYGKRLSRKNETMFKRSTAWLFYRILNFMAGVTIPKDTGDFRIISRAVRSALLECREPEPFLRGLVAWLGFNQYAFEYQRDERKFGTTKYFYRKMFSFALNAISSFSTLPLKFAIYLSFMSFVFCLALIGWAVGMHLHGGTVPGWASILSAFLFGQSMTLFTIGVIGLYVGKIHVGIQARPRYIVR